MQYAIVENGVHVRESRGDKSTRTADGLRGVNRNIEEQRQWRRERAMLRAADRASITNEEQIARLRGRPGVSKREVGRLEKALQ